jgi:2-amino-4-hydroxy-6-hydroxymethyldihydropteridine diphosphokinase
MVKRTTENGMFYFLSLGSNLGKRAKNLEKAITLLKKENLKILLRSSLYETQPVGYTEQPWFINMVILIETQSSPEALLELLQKIESKMERKRSIRYGPRIIDIDILLAEETVLKSKELEIPHPELEKRKFVLIPLDEISPETLHPVSHKNIRDLLKSTKDKSVVRKMEMPDFS